jgi:molecular chaperone DnaK (HSP70)
MRFLRYITNSTPETTCTDREQVVFEVDVNGILKVTATEKTSGRSANITISNSVGKLSSSEIESMINGS